MSDKINKNATTCPQSVNLTKSATKSGDSETIFFKKRNKKVLSVQLTSVSGGFDDRYRFYYSEDN